MKLLTESIAGVGPSVLRLVRTLIGPDPDLLAAAVDKVRADERARRADMRRDLHATIDAERAAHAETARSIEAAGGCTKIRLANEDEALQLAADLAASRGMAPEEFAAFPCSRCPRRPLRGAPRWWHIGNADPAKRTGQPDHGRARATERGSGRGFALADQLDPAVRARLEALAGVTDEPFQLPTDEAIAEMIDDYGVPIRITVGHLPACIAGWVEPLTGRVANDVAALLRRTADRIDAAAAERDA